MSKTHIFHVSGTHCAACKILIEDILREQEFVKNTRVDLKKETIEVETDSEKNASDLAILLSSKLKPNG